MTKTANIEARIQESNRRRIQMMALAALAVVVAVATVIALIAPGVGMTQGSLVCGIEEHTHTDACYELVLTCNELEAEELEAEQDAEALEGEEPEAKKHEHTDACYERVLVCEKTVHEHSDGCYEAEEVQAVEEPQVEEVVEENEPQVASDSLDVTNAGNEEAELEEIAEEDLAEATEEYAVEEEPVESDEMNTEEEFVEESGNEADAEYAEDEIESTEAETEAEDENAEELEAENAENTDELETTDEAAEDAEAVADEATDTPEEEAAPAGPVFITTDDETAEKIDLNEYPAQSFEKTLLDENGDTVLVVTVEAPAGAFPANTTMKVIKVETSDVAEVVEGAVAGKVEGKVVDALAADICFFNAEGEEIEPLKHIQVNMSSDFIAENEDSLVVHIDDNGKADVVETLSSDERKARSLEANNNELAFDSNCFSIYTVVSTSLKKTLTASDGKTYDISVECPAAAGIPRNAKLDVQEVLPTDKEYDESVEQALESLEEVPEQADARVFDISIVSKGKEVEPSAPVQLTVSLVDMPPEQLSVVHFAKEGDELLEPDEVAEDAITFTTESFSRFVFVTAVDPNTGNQRDLADGKGYGLAIALTDRNGTAAVLQSGQCETERYKDHRLAAEAVRCGVIDNVNHFFPEGEEPTTLWYFENRTENNGKVYYNIYTYVDADGQYDPAGTKMYLNASHASGHMYDDRGETWLSATPMALQVEAVDNNKRFTIRDEGGWALNVRSSNCENGFCTTSWQGANNYFNLFEPYAEYAYTDSAYLTSISAVDAERRVYGQSGSLGEAEDVIIYNEIWNENTQSYELYALDGNGKLVRVYESGDKLYWFCDTETDDSSPMKWRLIEYVDEIDDENGMPSGYYEFYNPATGKYLSPSASGLLSDGTVGLLLDGRTNDKYNSTIVAWDDAGYHGIHYVPEGDGAVAESTNDDAWEFQFATLHDHTGQPVPDHPEYEMVETVSSPYIKITMYDFPNRATMSNIIGSDEYIPNNIESGLLSATYAEGTEWPTTKAGRSLSDLMSDQYKKGDPSNLFLKSVYDATGYYYYNSAENYAWFDQAKNQFEVYRQLGTPKTGITMGNFLPYNKLAGSQSSVPYTQDTDPSNPRYGDPTYTAQGTTNYYFATRVDAHFNYPRGGLDQHGNPIVYEFTGDDDLWVYMDGVLLLDVGGIHAAQQGSINITTGLVKRSGEADTTIYQIFKDAGKLPDGSNWDDSRVDEFFQKNPSTGEYATFADYTGHSFSMFYMERGANRSNLRVKFNLPVVDPGTFTVRKNLGDSAQEQYANTFFAFQAFRGEVGEGELIGTEADPVNVATGQPIQFHTVKINGTTYENVFFLRPGEAASFTEDQTSKYYVRELGVKADDYEAVTVNGVTVDTDSHAEDGIITSSSARVSQRPEVSFTNTCSTANSRDLHITKELELGVPNLTDTFEFYVYLEDNSGDLSSDAQGNIVIGNGKLVPYAVGNYYIIDPDGNYCRNVGGKPVSTGSSTEPVIYAQSGPNGTIGNVPAGYTVVVPGLLANTDFLVVERNNIPEGYEYVSKVLADDDEFKSDAPDIDNITDNSEKVRVNGADGNTVYTSADGKIKSGYHSKVVVTNKATDKILVNKRWAPEKLVDAITQHGTVNVALFRTKTLTGSEGETEQLTLVPGTLREIVSGTPVEYDIANPANYVVREVEVTGEGSAQLITPVSDQGEIVVAGETMSGGATMDNKYTVTYEQGEIEKQGAAKVRADVIVNTIVGQKVSFKKVDVGDPENTALEGAVFDLYRVVNGEREATPMYADLTSGEDGMLVFGSGDDAQVAFDLGMGTYELAETATPDGYLQMTEAVEVNVGAGTVSYDDGSAYSRGGSGVSFDSESGVYTLSICNTSGKELPATGGSGTLPIYILGSLLVAISAAVLVLRRRFA